MDWIDPQIAIPKYVEDIIIVNDGVTLVGFYQDGFFDKDGEHLEHVSYWKPLPSPPE